MTPAMAPPSLADMANIEIVTGPFAVGRLGAEVNIADVNPAKAYQV